MRLIFMGTPIFAVPTLQALIQQGHDIVLCLTQPARPAGRGLKIQESPVACIAKKAGISVMSPSNINTEEIQTIMQGLKPDMMIVIAYGSILKNNILTIPRYACLNAHASLLPRWRGAAPIQRSIMANDTHTGVTIMRMNEGCDTGDIIQQNVIPISETMNSAQLHDKLANISATLTCDVLQQWNTSSVTFTPQDSQLSCHAKKITSEDLVINFHRDATLVDAQIRGLAPKPGAFFTMPIHQKMQKIKIIHARVITEDELTNYHSHPPSLKNTDTIRIINESLWLRCAHGAIQPLLLQRQGKNQMTITDFINGYKRDILSCL